MACWKIPPVNSAMDSDFWKKVWNSFDDAAAKGMVRCRVASRFFGTGGAPESDVGKQDVANYPSYVMFVVL